MNVHKKPLVRTASDSGVGKLAWMSFCMVLFDCGDYQAIAGAGCRCNRNRIAGGS